MILIDFFYNLVKWFRPTFYATRVVYSAVFETVIFIIFYFRLFKINDWLTFSILKRALLGHMLRNDNILKLSTEENMLGKTAGRSRAGMISDITDNQS